MATTRISIVYSEPSLLSRTVGDYSRPASIVDYKKRLSAFEELLNTAGVSAIKGLGTSFAIQSIVFRSQLDKLEFPKPPDNYRNGL